MSSGLVESLKSIVESIKPVADVDKWDKLTVCKWTMDKLSDAVSKSTQLQSEADILAASTVATRLMEFDFEIVARTVSTLGRSKSTQLLDEVEKMFANSASSEFLDDLFDAAGKLRAPGGVFLRLVKRACSPEERKSIFKDNTKRQQSMRRTIMYEQWAESRSTVFSKAQSGDGDETGKCKAASDLAALKELSARLRMTETRILERAIAKLGVDYVRAVADRALVVLSKKTAVMTSGRVPRESSNGPSDASAIHTSGAGEVESPLCASMEELLQVRDKTGAPTRLRTPGGVFCALLRSRILSEAEEAANTESSSASHGEKSAYQVEKKSASQGEKLVHYIFEGSHGGAHKPKTGSLQEMRESLGRMKRSAPGQAGVEVKNGEVSSSESESKRSKPNDLTLKVVKSTGPRSSQNAGDGRASQTKVPHANSLGMEKQRKVGKTWYPGFLGASSDIGSGSRVRNPVPVLAPTDAEYAVEAARLAKFAGLEPFLHVVERAVLIYGAVAVTKAVDSVVDVSLSSSFSGPVNSSGALGRFVYSLASFAPGERDIRSVCENLFPLGNTPTDLFELHGVLLGRDGLWYVDQVLSENGLVSTKSVSADLSAKSENALSVVKSALAEIERLRVTESDLNVVLLALHKKGSAVVREIFCRAVRRVAKGRWIDSPGSLFARLVRSSRHFTNEDLNALFATGAEGKIAAARAEEVKQAVYGTKDGLAMYQTALGICVSLSLACLCEADVQAMAETYMCVGEGELLRLVADTRDIEIAGGQMSADGLRRRLPCAVFNGLFAKLGHSDSSSDALASARLKVWENLNRGRKTLSVAQMSRQDARYAPSVLTPVHPFRVVDFSDMNAQLAAAVKAELRPVLSKTAFITSIDPRFDTLVRGVAFLGKDSVPLLENCLFFLGEKETEKLLDSTNEKAPSAHKYEELPTSSDKSSTSSAKLDALIGTYCDAVSESCTASGKASVLAEIRGSCAHLFRE